MRNSTKLFIPLFALTLFATGTAAAQNAPAARGIGVGAESTLTGIVGGTFVYDAAAWHLDAILGGTFKHDYSQVDVAARFFFPLHRGANADFSVGPGIGVSHVTVHDPDGGGPATSSNSLPVHLEGAAQIRAFLVPNVAVNATAGLGLVFNKENDNSAIFTGQVGSSFGITYFFF
ncbi:MAG TPA: hypothetical protein VHM25_23895 [Polyangiaceae bacterium]|jgi:hypothetical protein|nr:hypothetical protein [Polyangiaceae bacterium]